jgi:hypothetical protein
MANTTTLGMYTIPTTSPDYEGGNSPIAQLSANFSSLDAKHQIEVESANGAIGIKEGVAFVTKGTAAALTLALPTAGLPAAGGDDGKRLTVLSTTAAAHTVTTPAAGINAASTIATFGAAIGNCLNVVAYNGSWRVLPGTGITIS